MIYRLFVAFSILVPPLLLLSLSATAMAVWPTDWQALTTGGQSYHDLADENPDETDVVGDATYAAGFWAFSPTDDQLSLRMRLDADGTGSGRVWQFLLDTDGVASTVDWVLEVRQSGNPSGRQVILTQATTGGPTFDDLALSSSFAWTGALADWSRWSATGDGSNFDGDADFFLDLAIPWSEFETHVGPDAQTGFGVILASSTSHTQVNKDIPLGLSGTDSVSAAFSGIVPEPTSGALVSFGVLLLALRSNARAGRAR